MCVRSNPDFILCKNEGGMTKHVILDAKSHLGKIGDGDYSKLYSDCLCRFKCPAIIAIIKNP